MVEQLAAAAAAARPAIPRSAADRFKDSLVNWVVDSDLPFKAVQHHEFRTMLSILNGRMIDTLMPETGKTIAAWVDKKHLQGHTQLKESLAASPYKKHLSFDLWTSPNGLSLLGVVVHYFDGIDTFHTQLLGLERVFGAHSGEGLALAVERKAEEFDITQQIGYFQSDNATTSNNYCTDCLVERLNPTLDPASLTALKSSRRVRCFSHILNLVAKAFLEGKSTGLLRTLQPDSQAHTDAEEERGLPEQWRKRGPVGRLHNLVHWIRRSTQRREDFTRIASGKLLPEEEEDFGAAFFNYERGHLQLKADNDTRWNSVFFMIERAIQLRDPLDLFCFTWSRNRPVSKMVPPEDVLTSDDWSVLTVMKLTLEPFKIATKVF